MFVYQKTLGYISLKCALFAVGIVLLFIYQKYYAIIDNGAVDMRIIDRSEWLGRPAKFQYAQLVTPIKNVIICHTATDECSTKLQCFYRMRVIQKFHMDSLGWSDIGYNFLVGGDGQVYEARGWHTQGQHLKGYDAITLSIAFIGSFTRKEPPAQQIQAAQNLMAEGLRLRKLVANYRIYAASQFSATENTGAVFYKLIQSWSRWSNETAKLNHNNCDTLNIVKREYWLAQPAHSELSLLSHPAQQILLQKTRSESCATQAECIFQVRSLQAIHIETWKQPDIMYNFLIGGDGNVYEGRGWKYSDGSEAKANNGSISLAFIGIPSENITQKQINAAKMLLINGILLGKLSRHYKLSDPQKLLIPLQTINNTKSKTLVILPRSVWLAQPSQNEQQTLALPVALITIMPTQTDFCFTQAECILRTRFIQSLHMASLKINDIAYNFLIGSDGNVYEGRGWNSVCDKMYGCNDNMISVDFIGTFVKQKPTTAQVKAMNLLMNLGVCLNKLTKNYELIEGNTSNRINNCRLPCFMIN